MAPLFSRTKTNNKVSNCVYQSNVNHLISNNKHNFYQTILLEDLNDLISEISIVRSLIYCTYCEQKGLFFMNKY